MNFCLNMIQSIQFKNHCLRLGLGPSFFFCFLEVNIMVHIRTRSSCLDFNHIEVMASTNFRLKDAPILRQTSVDVGLLSTTMRGHGVITGK